MSSLLRYNLLPPFNESKEFERFVCSVFNDIYETKDFDTYGREGEDQEGIDIISLDNKIAVQCKIKKATHNPSNSKTSKDLIKELNNDFEQFISHFDKEEVNQFHFATDFLDDLTIKKECRRLQNETGIKVDYWHWERLLNNASKSTISKYLSLFSDATSDYYFNRKPSSFELNSDVEFSRNLMNLFQECYENLNYIPVHILINNEVFKDSTSKKYSYYENFALRSNREDLIDLFKNAEYKNQAFKFNNCDLSIEESNQIIDILWRNCIYYITDGSRENYFELPTSSKNCDCISCSLKKFNLVRVLKLLNDLESDSLQDLTYKGYFLFQVGRLKSSLKLFKKILEKSLQDGNSVFANIARYNLNKLYRLIPFINNSGAESTFDLLHEYSPINNTIEDETIKWLIADDFLIDAQFQINDLKSKLISIYESVNNGGSARNSIILSVHNKFLQYSQFLVLNNIIYDNFIEDSQIKSDFVECLVCAIGIGEKNSGLRGWNDYTIQLVIENAEYKELLRALRRYNLRSIQHINDKSQAQYNLKELYSNLFLQQTDLFENLNKEENTYLIRGKLNRLYANAIILLAYLDLKAQEFNSLLSLILECFSRENLLDNQSIKYIATIINKKESLISKSNSQKLFKSILRYPQLHEREIIGTSFKLFAEKPENINVSRSDFNELKSQFFGRCELCSRGHDEMDIINMWHFANEFREEIEHLITNRITGSSDSELQYLSICEDILPYDQKIVDKLISNSISNSAPVGEKIFGIGNNINFYFLQLIHLIFKYGIDTQTEKFDKIRELGDYYRWLLDPVNYDYDLFYTDWLFNIYNIETLNKLKEIPEIKENLSSELSENPNDKRLLQTFVRLYKDRKEEVD